MIILPKKNEANKCSNYSTVNLISCNGKIFALMLSKRLESNVEEVIEDKFGFWKDKGTRDAIGLMRIISQRVLDVKKR